MIYRKTTLNDFIAEFVQMGRNDFSYEGYRVLFEHIEDMISSNIFEYPYILDVIAVASEYVEDKTVEVLAEYDMNIQTLIDHTTVIEVDSETIIYAIF